MNGLNETELIEASNAFGELSTCFFVFPLMTGFAAAGYVNCLLDANQTVFEEAVRIVESLLQLPVKVMGGCAASILESLVTKASGVKDSNADVMMKCGRHILRVSKKAISLQRTEI